MAANPPLLDTSSTDKSSNTSNILLATEVTAAVAAAAAPASTTSSSTTGTPTIATKPRPTCSCTNISIMQLFHEMKQEFPTVPDHVVSQCVLENCHDRLACIENLNKEALGHLGLQAYPSQTLHNNIKFTGLPRRLSGESKFNNNNNNTNYDKNINNNNNISGSSSTNSVNVTNNYDNNNLKLNINNNNNNNINPYLNNSNNNNNNNNKFQKCVNNFNNIIKSDYKSSDMSQSKSDNNRKIPQRPTTLSLSSKPNPSGTFSRPTRVAPPPPPPVPTPIPSTLPQKISTGISSALTSALAVVPTASNVHHHYHHQSPIVAPGTASTSATAAATSVITTTSTTTDSPANAESINVSLNVTVSPVSPRPPVRPPRHTTAISVQPEPAYIRDVPTSPRSYTSVNFTLRQPSQSPQSPIDISAGPSLTYTSSSFDARQGYQSRLQITMGGGGGGGSISAMRTRPRNIYNMAAIQNDNDDDDLSNALVNPKSEAEIVHRQLVKKQCLSSELTNDKGRLETMQREIRALQAPLPIGGSTKLQEDIDQLQFQCKQMASEIEAAGNYVLGETNEAFYQNIYTGQKLPAQSRPPKPPRPPPPRPPAIQPLINNNNNFINNNNNRTDLNNSGNGGGDSNFNLTDNNNDNNSNVNTNTNENNNNNNGEGGQPWTCSMCTFSNHPLLDKCEQCEMPRISSGTVPIGPQLNRQRLQDRHYQQSPPSPNIPIINNYDNNSYSNTNSTTLPVETPVSNTTATTTSTAPINTINQFFNSDNDLTSLHQQIEKQNINLTTSNSSVAANFNLAASNDTLLDTDNINLTNERILLLLPNVITDHSTIITTSSEGIHIHLSPGQRIIHSWVVS